MKENQISVGDDQYRFHTTRWSMVLLSAQSQAPGFQAALSELYKIYRYPLYAYVRRRGHAPEEAQDLTQGFFLHLLEHKTLGRADPLKGKFRSFLLGSLQNYLSAEADRTRCLKRGGGVEFIPLDLQDAENRYKLEPIDTLTPEKLFAARWAVALLGEAMNRLRREYASPKKAAALEVLKAFLDVDNSKALPSYEEAAATLQVSVGAVKTLIHRLRKQYALLVREDVERTVSDPGDVDAEIHELCEAVMAKIIDLGLAKAVDESGAQTTISASGAFAGTPEFASPEQIAGGEVDIRSDLYSLGVSLWQMLTGHVPFRGTAAGVMSQHKHASLPLEKLQGVPQPVISLIEVLLNKDPGRRFQTPAELLKALPTIRAAIDEGRTITYQSFGQMPAGDFYSATRKPPPRMNFLTLL